MRLRLTVLCGVQFVDVLGVTSAITAIPAILRGLDAPPAAAPILATAYAMCFGGLLVLGARLGDRHGHRRVLLAGIAAFGAAGLVGAGAQSVAAVVAARGLQGAAAAVSVPSALRLLLTAASGRGALAAWSASGAAAGALGLLAGGLLTAGFGWRSVFLINVPVEIVLAFAVARFVARSAPGPRTPLDVAGAALLTGALMAVIVGAALSEEHRVAGILLAGAGLALGAAFRAQQRRARAPLIPRAAVASPNLRLGAGVSFVNTATTSSTGVLATLLMQQRLGLSAVAAGIALLPFSLGVIAGAAASKRVALSTRGLAAAGTAAIAARDLLLALTYGTVAPIVAGVLVAGCGLGVASVAGTAIGTDVEERLTGTATGVLNTAAQLGTALGVAALLVVAAAAGTAVAWGAGAALAGLTAVTVRPRRSRTPRGSSPPVRAA